MSDHDQSLEREPARSSNVRGPARAATAKAPVGEIRAVRYPEMQSAVRFPIKLPISLKSKAGECRTESENISANGVLFELDASMPVGSPVDFTISLPAAIVGAERDVQIDCRGRVVRSSLDGGRPGVAVVIDEYHFEGR
jgi:hypothetical protein